MCVCLECVYANHMLIGTLRDQKRASNNLLLKVYSCIPPCTGDGNQTQILYKSSN